MWLFSSAAVEIVGYDIVCGVKKGGREGQGREEGGGRKGGKRGEGRAQGCGVNLWLDNLQALLILGAQFSPITTSFVHKQYAV